MNNSLKNLLKVFGIESKDMIGSGAYSSVYNTNKGTVLKFTVDSMYIRYLEEIEGKDFSFAPKVLNNFGIVGYVRTELFDGCRDNVMKYPIYAVELPKYASVWDSGLDNEVICDVLGAIERFCDHEYKSFRVCQPFHRSSHFLNQHLGSLLSAGFDPMEVFDFSNTVKDILSNEPAFNDMHIYNIMWDKESKRIIVTDPIGSKITRHTLESSYKTEIADTVHDIVPEKIEEISKLFNGKPMDVKFIDFVKKQEKISHESGINIEVNKSDDFYDIRRKVAYRNEARGELFDNILGIGAGFGEDCLVEIRKQRKKMGLSMKADDEELEV